MREERGGTNECGDRVGAVSKVERRAKWLWNVDKLLLKRGDHAVAEILSQDEESGNRVVIRGRTSPPCDNSTSGLFVICGEFDSGGDRG